jgi:hypothetical protein
VYPPKCTPAAMNSFGNTRNRIGCLYTSGLSLLTPPGPRHGPGPAAHGPATRPHHVGLMPLTPSLGSRHGSSISFLSAPGPVPKPTRIYAGSRRISGPAARDPNLKRPRHRAACPKPTHGFKFGKAHGAHGFKTASVKARPNLPSLRRPSPLGGRQEDGVTSLRIRMGRCGYGWAAADADGPLRMRMGRAAWLYATPHAAAEPPRAPWIEIGKGESRAPLR